MYEQEKEHRAKFEKLLPQYRVRPSLLTPFWTVAGYALGRYIEFLFNKIPVYFLH